MAKGQRCQGFCTDGSRCGKTAKNGHLYCIKHNGQAPVGVIAQQQQAAQAAMTPLDHVREIMNNSKDESIRLRASEKYLDLLDREAAKDRVEKESVANTVGPMLDHCTVEQANRWCDALDVCSAVHDDVEAYVKIGGKIIPKSMDRQGMGRYVEPEPDEPTTAPVANDPLLTIVKAQPESEQESDDEAEDPRERRLAWHHAPIVEPVPTSFDERQALHILRASADQKNYLVALSMQGLTDLPDEWKVFRHLAHRVWECECPTCLWSTTYEE